MHLSLGIYKMPPVVQVRTWIATLNGADEEADYSLWMERLVTSGVVKFICGQLSVGNRKGVCISSTWSNWSAPDA